MDLLMSKVHLAPGGCWDWTGALDRGGYGRTWSWTKVVAAHRLSYELRVGPIPVGLDLDHLCRNRRCVNPDHLEPVTRRENVLRGEGPSGQAARRTHCPTGHALEGDNLLPAKLLKGKRECRKCSNEKQNARAAARRTHPIKENAA